MALPELLGQSAAPEPVPPTSAPVMAELVSVEQVPVEPAAKPRLRKGLLIGIGAGVAVLANCSGRLVWAAPPRWYEAGCAAGCPRWGA